MSEKKRKLKSQPKIQFIKQGHFTSTWFACYSYCFVKNGAMILSLFVLLSLIKSRMNVIKYTIRGERIKIKGSRKLCQNMAMICILAIAFVCFQLPFVSYNGQFFPTSRTGTKD